MKPSKTNFKTYGSIPHLPGSKLGPKEITVSPGQAKMCFEKLNDKNDTLIIQEKLDGSCVVVYRAGNEIIPLTRNGFLAKEVGMEQFQKFSDYVQENSDKFLAILKDGYRLCGEWLYQAHGTKYFNLNGNYFYPFDLFVDGQERLGFQDFKDVMDKYEMKTPHVFHKGNSLPLEQALTFLKQSHHGGEYVEGLIYRIYRKDRLILICKYVDPKFVTGKYLFVDKVDIKN